MSTNKVSDIKDYIADIKARLPANSVPQSMWEQPEEKRTDSTGNGQ